MKRVTQTAAGKSISAYVILKKGKEVANVQAHFGNSVVTVDIWAQGMELQQGRAGGGGYDKFTAALSNAVIDGIKLNDHCGTNEETEKILSLYHSGKLSEKAAKVKAAKIGASFANYGMLGKKKKYGSLYLLSGLDKLKAIGYTVIQAI